MTPSAWTSGRQADLTRMNSERKNFFPLRVQALTLQVNDAGNAPACRQGAGILPAIPFFKPESNQGIMAMRRLFTFATGAFSLILGGCADLSEPVAPESPPSATALVPILPSIQRAERVMPGRVLARVSAGADPADVANTHDVAFERQAAGGAFALFRGAAGNERALAARLGSDDRVVWAEPDYLRETTEVDPSLLWAFDNPGGLQVLYTRGRNSGKPVSSYRSLNDADEDASPGSWGSSGGPVAIASIDTGVEFSHPEFGQAELVAGRDFYDNDDDPSDTNDHGTHTTGTMVGDNVGVAGAAGAARNVKVYVYRVCGPLGCPTSAIAAAIRAAADAGVVAMNLSLGGGSLGQAEADAISYATGLNALVIASAGNGGTGTVNCPACDPNAISVAASNWQDELSYYSSWGPGLDLTAPGGELYSNTTSEAGIYSAVRGAGYRFFQGTSMAAPQVTGTAAVVASVTGKRGAALRAALEGSADDLGDAGYDTRFGYGRLNSQAAVSYSGGQDPPPPPPSETLAAAFSYSCDGPDCTFDGSGSTGTIANFGWDFGDGGSGSGMTVSHVFGDPGDYTVTLTVIEVPGVEASTKMTVRCRLRGKKVRCG
jgi:serine protease